MFVFLRKSAALRTTHVAFSARNVEVVLDRMRELGMVPLSKSGSWMQINATLRAVYTRDRDGFFIEVIERA